MNGPRTELPVLGSADGRTGHQQQTQRVGCILGNFVWRFGRVWNLPHRCCIKTSVPLGLAVSYPVDRSCRWVHLWDGCGT